jgi:hypothetical protein
METTNVANDKSDGFVWCIVQDGTSNGEYENCACVAICSSEEDAIAYINAELQDQVVNALFCGTDYTQEEIERETKDHVEWFDSHTARFVYGDSVADYRALKLRVPRGAKEVKK